VGKSGLRRTCRGGVRHGNFSFDQILAHSPVLFLVSSLRSLLALT
jgi:hypothetical protein